MPMKKGCSTKTRQANIREFHKGATYAHTKSAFGEDRANAQAVAASYSACRASKKKRKRGRA